jgi:S1-C subfamily serine protease
VGVNSAKIAAPGYEGLGFSIPIKEAQVIIDDLVKYGYVKNRVMLGITGVDIAQPRYAKSARAPALKAPTPGSGISS